MSERKILMIPGPIESKANVLRALGAPTLSHTSPDFIKTFGNCLEMMKKVWGAPSGQPFIMAGSGTLAMEMAAANLIEPGDAVTLANGPFADLAGRVELVAPDRRIWVLIDLMGRQTRVAVSEDALR